MSTQKSQTITLWKKGLTVLFRLRWDGQSYNGWCPRKTKTWTQTQRGKGMGGEGQTGVMLPQARETQGIAEGSKSQGRSPPQSYLQEQGPANTLISDFWPPEL